MYVHTSIYIYIYHIYIRIEFNGPANWLGWLETTDSYASAIAESSQAEVGPTNWPRNIHDIFS